MAVWVHINYNISKGKGSKDLSKLVKYHNNVSTNVESEKRRNAFFFLEKKKYLKKTYIPPFLQYFSWWLTSRTSQNYEYNHPCRSWFVKNKIL